MKLFTRYRKLIGAISAVGGVAVAVVMVPKLFRTEDLDRTDTQNLISKIVKWDTNWDKRDPASLFQYHYGDQNNLTNEQKSNFLKKITPTKSRNIFLIRHGNYNLSGNMDAERYLTTIGQEQAEYTANRLKELNFPYNVILSSTMTRAIETANIISKSVLGVPMKQTDILTEGPPISCEPKTGVIRPKYQFFVEGARIEAAFRKYFHRAEPSQTEDSYEIIVCHANVIRYIVCRALQVAPEAWLRFSLGHGSITWLIIPPSGYISLRSIGDTGFIPSNKVTFN